MEVVTVGDDARFGFAAGKSRQARTYVHGIEEEHSSGDQAIIEEVTENSARQLSNSAASTVGKRDTLAWRPTTRIEGHERVNCP